MPDTCEKNESSTPKFLNRRSFLRYAAAAVIGVGAAQFIAPGQAFAVTSAEKQAEADALKRKMDEWEVQLEQYASDYYDAMDAYDRAVANMAEAQERIDAAVAREAELQTTLDQRARNMYKQGPMSFMDIIFGSRSFVEFTTSWDLLNTLNGRDAALIAECQAAREEAEAARAEYALQEQIAKQKLAEAEEIYIQGQELLAAYESELANLEAEVAELIEAERRAEEERLRREEEARRAREAANRGSGGGGGGNPGGYVPYDGTRYSSIVEAAYSRLGCPYIWAASGPNEFDCSGLTSWCYRLVGIYIPRGGNAQYTDAPMRMEVWEAEPGDILWKPGHVGIYIGGGQYIHAPRPGDVVRIGNISSSSWVGASRWY